MRRRTATRVHPHGRGRGGCEEVGQPGGEWGGGLVAGDGVGPPGDGAARGDDVAAGRPGVDVPAQSFALVPGGVAQGRAGRGGEVQVQATAPGAHGERVPGPGLPVPLAQHRQTRPARRPPPAGPTLRAGCRRGACGRPGPAQPARTGRWPPRFRRARRPSRLGYAPDPRWPDPPTRGARRHRARCAGSRPHRAGRGTCCSARAGRRTDRAQRRSEQPRRASSALS